MLRRVEPDRQKSRAINSYEIGLDGFDSRRLHHLTVVNKGSDTLSSRPLHYFSTAGGLLELYRSAIASSKAAGRVQKLMRILIWA